MDKKEKLLFAIAELPDGTPLVTLGVSKAAWEYMRDGKTQTLDLRKLGIRAQIVLFGGETYESVSKTVIDGLRAQGITVDDQRSGPDYGIKH